MLLQPSLAGGSLVSFPSSCRNSGVVHYSPVAAAVHLPVELLRSMDVALEAVTKLCRERRRAKMGPQQGVDGVNRGGVGEGGGDSCGGRGGADGGCSSGAGGDVGWLDGVVG